jgi:hypothetical protein
MKEKNYRNEYMIDFFAGGIAGSAAWFLILPLGKFCIFELISLIPNFYLFLILDIVKTRQQSDKDKDKTIIESLKKLTKEQGLKANFTLGLAPLLIRGFLVNATTFLIYVQTLKLLNKF